MNKLCFTLAAILIAAASVGARGDGPAAAVAEPPNAANPAGQAPVVDMPLKGDEPMPTKMKNKGMKKEDVKKEYIKKEPMIEEIMEKGEVVK